MWAIGVAHMSNHPWLRLERRWISSRSAGEGGEADCPPRKSVCEFFFYCRLVSNFHSPSSHTHRHMLRYKKVGKMNARCGHRRRLGQKDALRRHVNVSLLQHPRLTNHGEPRRPPPRGWWGRPAPMCVALPTHPHLLVWATIEQFLPVGTT